MNRYCVLNFLIAIALVASVLAIDCNAPPPDKIDLMQCCPYESLISKDISDKCKSFLDGNDEPPAGGPRGGPRGPGGPGGHRHSPCYMECVVNETGIMNGKEIDEAGLKNYLSSVWSANADFIPIGQNAFNTCFNKVKEIGELMEKNPPPPGVSKDKMCKPCAGMMMHCVRMEVMINCPASAWKNDDDCNNTREFVKTCKPKHPEHDKHPH